MPKLTADVLRAELSYNKSTGLFRRRVARNNRTKVGDVAGSVNNDGYTMISVLNKSYGAHRLAWLYVIGCWPEAEVDHRNHIRTDNRWRNLRAATKKQNHENELTRANSSGVKGVHWDAEHRKWRACIRHNKRLINLGRFGSLATAARVRGAAEKQFFTHYR
jgi:hypothetical protein